MLSSTIEVTFKVQAEARPGEQVCVVGDCPELGSWRPPQGKPLKLVARDEDGDIWSCVVRLPPLKVLQYRYFIGTIREGENEGESCDVSVRLWETNILPRTFRLQDYFLDPSLWETSIAQFGHYNGRKSVGKGCLSGQTEIHLRLHTSPLKMWKSSHRVQTYRIKCTPMDLRFKDISIDCDDEDSNHDLIMPIEHNKVEVSVFRAFDGEPVVQPQFGTVLRENDYMVFRTKSFEPEFLGYQFDLYLHDENAGPHDIAKHVGIAYLLPLKLESTKQVKTLHINSLKHKPIGQLTVDCLIVKPLKEYQCDMSVSYANHWKHDRRPLDIGHRGMGSSYTKCAAVRENTLASFAAAGGHGADLVEFDVMLTQDQIPVIYHDYHILMTLKKKHKDETDWFQIPVHDLTLTQLQKLKVDHLSEKTKSSSPGSSPRAEVDPLERQPFPTLRQCLEDIDPHVGFYIEIKYPQPMLTGELEDGLKHFPDGNEYVDVILKDVLQYGGSRRIILSCFDADICIMTNMKQNKYPTVFTSQGESERYPWYKDVRCHTTPIGCSFAISERLLGVSLHTEDLLKYPEMTQKAKGMNLVVFCWGDDCDDKDTIKSLKNQGVDAVIYDRIHELKGSKENVFKMEHEAKLQLLKEVGALPDIGNMSPSSGGTAAPSPPSSSCAAVCGIGLQNKHDVAPGGSSEHLSEVDAI